MTELSLAASEARDVLAAVVARVAQDAEQDVLLIKGPSLSAHGLRAERAWGDVDILVRPDQVSRMRHELADSGWAPFNETPDYPLITLPYAVTFIHPRWHTAIDLHTFLPGSYADPAVTFARLWADRTKIELAHHPVSCTGRVGSALVAALNLARTPAKPRTHEESRHWVAAVRNWSDADRFALADLAAECRAADVLASLLDAASVPPRGRGVITQQEWTDWHDRVGHETYRGYAWRAALRRAPAHTKPRFAIRAIMYEAASAERGEPPLYGWARLRHVMRRFAFAASLPFRRRP